MHSETSGGSSGIDTAIESSADGLNLGESRDNQKDLASQRALDRFLMRRLTLLRDRSDEGRE